MGGINDIRYPIINNHASSTDWSRQNSTVGEIIKFGISCDGLAIDEEGYFYVSNRSDGAVERWNMGCPTIHGNKHGSESNQLAFPKDLAIDQEGHLYVVDSYNHRVQKFLLDSN